MPHLGEVAVRDRVLLETYTNLISMVSNAWVYVEEVDRSERLLEGLGVKQLIEGVEISNVTLEAESSTPTVSSATIKLLDVYL
jgi:hypothetical protein